VAFGLGKLQVLESKLDIYEDLSKEMLDKLERAVTTISDNSNKIAIVLERHENRSMMIVCLRILLVSLQILKRK